MCKTGKCPYENVQGNCTVPKVPEDALCYHPKIDAYAVDSSFAITSYMANRQTLRVRQQAICDEIMAMTDRNTVDGHERLMTDWRERRQAILDSIAEYAPEPIAAPAIPITLEPLVQKIIDAPWEPLEGKMEDVQRIANVLEDPKIVILDPPSLPTKAEIDALTTGTDKVSRIRACRRIMHLGLKEALHHVNQLYY